MIKENLKKHRLLILFLREMRRYFLYALFFALLLSAFTNYRRLILEEYHITYNHYGYSIIEALILAKVVMIGQQIGVGNRFLNQPLMVPILHKTIVFCILVFVFGVVEHFTIGFFKGVDPAVTYQRLMNINIYEIGSRIIIMFFVFIFFFAVLESSRVVGDERMFSLFFKKKKVGKKESKD